MPRERAGRARVDVWLVDPSCTDPGAFLDDLDQVERSRAAALPRSRAAAFVLARALLRRVLAERLARPPVSVHLRASCPACGGLHGRLEVAEPVGAHVSISRAGPQVAVALSQDGPVGVDIEAVDGVPGAVADVVLTPGEARAHRRLRPRARQAALARTWVRKEAVLKALGTGLARDPADVALDGPAGTSPAFTRTIDGVSLVVTDLVPGPGHTGAVALVLPHAASLGRATGLVVRLHDGAELLPPAVVRS